MGQTQLYKEMGWFSLTHMAKFQNNKHIHRTLITRKPKQVYRQLTNNRSQQQILDNDIVSKTRSDYNMIPTVFRKINIKDFKFQYRRYCHDPTYIPKNSTPGNVTQPSGNVT